VIGNPLGLGIREVKITRNGKSRDELPKPIRQKKRRVKL